MQFESAKLRETTFKSLYLSSQFSLGIILFENRQGSACCRWIKMTYVSPPAIVKIILVAKKFVNCKYLRINYEGEVWFGFRTVLLIEED